VLAPAALSAFSAHAAHVDMPPDMAYEPLAQSTHAELAVAFA
jgi:hypothetical protein